jgi:hypothetical protein
MLLLRSIENWLTKAKGACYYQFPESCAPVWPAHSSDSFRCPPKQVKEEVVN